ARAVEVADDHRVDTPVVLLHAREVEIEQLETADLLPADVAGELSGGAERHVEHRGLPESGFGRPHATPGSGRVGSRLRSLSAWSTSRNRQRCNSGECKSMVRRA